MEMEGYIVLVEPGFKANGELCNLLITEMIKYPNENPIDLLLGLSGSAPNPLFFDLDNYELVVGGTSKVMIDYEGY